SARSLWTASSIRRYSNCPSDGLAEPRLLLQQTSAFLTPKALHSPAQGRAAHPGKAVVSGFYAEGVTQQRAAKMAQSLAKVYLHIVFSTKNRRPLLVHPQARGACHAYLAGTCKARGSPSLIVGGAADHVHILC